MKRDRDEESSDDSDETTDTKVGIVYKLICKDISVKDIYVGATTETLRRRWTHHKNKYKAFIHRKVYAFIKIHGGINQWELVEIESVQFTDIIDLRKKEQYWKDNLNASLNVFRCHGINVERRKIVAKEWRQSNKQNELEYAKRYRENNKEKIKQRKKKYNEKNKEKNSQYRREYRKKKKLEK